MNLRALSLAAAVGTLIATSAGAQAQGGYAPVDTSQLVTQTQLANQSASDVAQIPPVSVQAGTNYGFLTSTQTQALLAAISQTFISGFTPTSAGTTANLLANNPASASNVGRYAVVSDLFGGTNEVLRAGYTSGVGYYWRPQRTDYAAAVVGTGGAITLTPLANAPYVYLSGQLASNLTINLSTTNAWPGATFVVSNNLTLGLFTLNVNGTGMSAVNMASGASKAFVYDGTSWRPF